MARMVVPLSTLGTLLDLPDGVAVSGVDATEGAVVLHLDGLDAAGDDQVSAEYSVDTAGHRSFVTFKAPEESGEAGGTTSADEQPDTAATDPKPARRRGGSA